MILLNKIKIFFIKIIKNINIFILIIINLVNYILIRERRYYNCYFIIKSKNNLLKDDNFKCSKKRFININYLNEIENHNQKIDIFILDSNSTRIENTLILIGIFPFIKNNSFVLLRIKSKLTYQTIKKVLKVRTLKKKYIMLYKKDIMFLYNNFTTLLSYNWELIPSFSFLNNIRYIINNYYTDKFLDIYDTILNVIFKNYISKNKYSFSYENIKELMSKYFNIYKS